MGNCIIPAILFHSRLYALEREKLYNIYSMFMFYFFCVLERGKSYHTYKMFMFYNLCIRKKETVLFLQYVYEGNRIIPTKCLCSIICVSERKKLYYILQYVYVLFSIYQKGGNCGISGIC